MGASEIRLDSSLGAGAVARYDLARYSPTATRTPQGFLKAPAVFTRVGVFEYTRADGSTVRELRPPDEVFHPDSLATLAGAPLTRGHDAGMVSPQNARKVAIGWAGEKVERKDSLVAGTVTVMDAEALADIDAGKLREISMGYRCRIDATAGVDPEHGRYDQVQRDIRYNHVALGGTNWGRAGTDVGLRLDAQDARRLDATSSLRRYVEQQCSLCDPPMTPAKLAEACGYDAWSLDLMLEGYDKISQDMLGKIAKACGCDVQALMSLAPRMDAGERKVPKMETIVIGGVEFEVPKAAAQAMRNAQARTDGDVKKLTAERDGLQGRLDAATAELATVKTKLAAAEDPARLDSAVAEREALVSKARKVLGTEAEIKGTKRQIQELVVKHDAKDLDLTGKSDDYVSARFDAIVDRAPAAQDPAPKIGAARAAALKAAGGGAGDERQDAIDPNDAEAARARMVKRNAELWKELLSATPAK